MQRRALKKLAFPIFNYLPLVSGTCMSSAPSGGVQWVFLGPPGVGKGTYASRVAKALGVPHIAAGDLVRAAIKSGSTLGEQVGADLGGDLWLTLADTLRHYSG